MQLHENGSTGREKGKRPGGHNFGGEGPLQHHPRHLHSTVQHFIRPVSTTTSDFCHTTANLPPFFSPCQFLHTKPVSLYHSSHHPPPNVELLKMASRPQNIGIKAIEIYFPSQVCAGPLPPAIFRPCSSRQRRSVRRPSSRSPKTPPKKTWPPKAVYSVLSCH